MRAIGKAPRGFAITLSDGTLVRLPRTLFVDGDAAEEHVRSRIERGPKVPYRAP